VNNKAFIDDLELLVRLYGWTGDLSEVMNFLDWCSYALTGKKMHNTEVIESFPDQEKEVFNFKDNSNWSMIDLLPEATGVPVVIMAMSKDCVLDVYGPRIRVAPDKPIFHTDELVSLALDCDYSNPQQLDKELYLQLKEFIMVNFLTLLKYWENKINGAELKLTIVNIGKQ